MRRSFLSILVLVATLVSIVATPAATFAHDDDDDDGHSKQHQKQQKNQKKHNDKKHHDDDDFQTASSNFRTVGVCHFTGSERGAVFVFIRIPEEAVAAHQAHGDIVGVTSAQACAQQTAVAASSTGTINIGDAVCREGETCTFTVWQSRGTGSATVAFMTEDVTATGGASCTQGIDYVSQVGTVSVAPASTTTLSIQTCTDNLQGPDEAFRVRLTGASGGTTATATFATTASESNTVFVATSSAAAIKDGTGRGIILETSVATMGSNTVLATADAMGNVTINWGSPGGIEHRVYVSPGSGCTFGTDRRVFSNAATSGVVTGLMPPNTLFCFQARRAETNGTETILTATATTGVGGTTGAQLSINDATCAEGTLCTFTVTQTGGTSTPTMVTYSTFSGSASGGGPCPGLDFQQVTNGSVSVSQAQPGIITVQTCADGPGDPLENFSVVLSPLVGVTLTKGTGVGTITGT